MTAVPTSTVLSLNKADTQYKWNQLPDWLRGQIAELHAQGFVVEVFGVITKTWQPLHHAIVSFHGSKYYRLAGAPHCAAKRKGHKLYDWYHISDPVRLEQGHIAYTYEGSAFTAKLTKY